MRAPLSWFTDVLRQGDPAWSATAVEVDAGFVRVGFEIEDVEPFRRSPARWSLAASKPSRN